MEYKVTLSRPREIDGRTVTGIAAVMGNIDDGRDRIVNGAFRKTISENGARVRVLWMHDPYQPPSAAIKAISEVGIDQLPADLVRDNPEVTGGLMVTREYLDTPRGNEILAGIKAGAISEMSFGYDVIKADTERVSGADGEYMIRNLREVRLWDVSDVTWGMNSLTVASKARDARAEYLLSELAAMKSGRVLSARNLGRLKEALATLEEILLAAEPPEDEEYLKALTAGVLTRLAIAEREPIITY